MILYCSHCEERTPTFGEARCTFCYKFKGWDAYYGSIKVCTECGGTNGAHAGRCSRFPRAARLRMTES